MVKTKLLKNFELYELQWSRLLHFRSGIEATGGLEKNKNKRKRLLELEWDSAHFLKSSHNIAGCIVAHSRLSRRAGLGALEGGRDTAGHGQETIGHSHDTIGHENNTVGHAHDTAEEAYDTTYSSASGDIARGTARDTACYTVGARCDTAEWKAMIRPGEACDMAPGAPRHGRPCPQRARSLGHRCVHTVNLTQF